MRLTDFKVLSFDCYGTLIDWETGIYAALQPLLGTVGPQVSRDDVLRLYARHEAAQENETPSMVYQDILARVYERMAREWGLTPPPEDATAFARSIQDWPAFADSPSALQYLKPHYRLVILSNVDREGFRHSKRKRMVEFDAICTAQDIGSYKPDVRNFEYMLGRLREMGYERKDVLHTAESLYHDHAPANRLGIASAWIHRRHGQDGHGATGPPAAMPHYDFRFTSLAEMAKAHREELRADGG